MTRACVSSWRRRDMRWTRHRAKALSAQRISASQEGPPCGTQTEEDRSSSRTQQTETGVQRHRSAS